MCITKGTIIQEKNKLNTILQLAKNDIRSRYSNSLLGIVWAFVMPLVTILVFWYVFQRGFKNLPVGDAPYILWFSAAYIPWIFFVDVVTQGFFVVFLLVMFLVYGYGLTPYALQIIYYSFSVCALGLGLTWLLAAVTVFFKDMNALVNVLIQIGFWVTPILWNEDTMVDLSVRKVLSVNPMHYIVNGYRDSMIFHRWFWENPGETITFWVITLLIWILGRVVFRRLSPFFADEV